jgi:hypothetical protein
VIPKGGIVGLIEDALKLFERFPRAVTAFAYSLAVLVTLLALIVITSLTTGARFTLYPSFGFDTAVWPRRTISYVWGREYDVATIAPIAQANGGFDLTGDFKANTGFDVNPKNTFCYLVEARNLVFPGTLDIQAVDDKYKLVVDGGPTFGGTLRVSCVKLP